VPTTILHAVPLPLLWSYIVAGHVMSCAVCAADVRITMLLLPSHDYWILVAVRRLQQCPGSLSAALLEPATAGRCGGGNQPGGRGGKAAAAQQAISSSSSSSSDE